MHMTLKNRVRFRGTLARCVACVHNKGYVYS